MKDPIKAKRIMIIINICVILFIISLCAVLGVYFWDDLKLLSTSEGQREFANRISQTGFWGILIMIVLQVLQVVVAFIPGEFIEIISGMLFGTMGGLFICIIGLSLGTICIFGLVKLLGKPFLDFSMSEEKQNKYKLKGNATKSLIMVFFIFLIPGTPKDFITYAIPFTKIKLTDFLVVSSIARIPSIVSSTLIGEALINGHSGVALWISIIMAIIGIIGLLFSNSITNKIEELVKKYHDSKV